MKKKDGRKNNGGVRINAGGIRPNAGAKKKPSTEKKKWVQIGIKNKHIEPAMNEIRPIVKKWNKRP